MGRKPALLQSSTPKTHLGKVKATVTDSNNVRTGVIIIPPRCRPRSRASSVSYITVTGNSTATSVVPTYLDVYLLLDNT
jgi:hypothetical protein